MNIEEIQAQLDALQKALDERKAQAVRHSPTKRVGDLEWECNVLTNVTRDEAQAIAQARGDGFRLPTIHELLSLVDYGHLEPACSVFPNAPPVQMWSSTTVRNHAARGWVVSFYGGSVHGIDGDKRAGVRLVRPAAAVRPTQASLFDKADR